MNGHACSRRPRVSKTRITAAGPKLNVCFWNLFENPLQDVKNALASGPERDRVSQLLNNSHCGGKWEVGGLTWGGGCQQPKLWFLLIKPSSTQLSVLLPCNQLTVDHYFCFKDCPFNYTAPLSFLQLPSALILLKNVFYICRIRYIVLYKLWMYC